MKTVKHLNELPTKTLPKVKSNYVVTNFVNGVGYAVAFSKTNNEVNHLTDSDFVWKKYDAENLGDNPVVLTHLKEVREEVRSRRLSVN